MRYFFRVEYEGTRYGGWQRQPNAPSIQETLEGAFATVTRAAACPVTGAGRTDAGVHALAQGAHVDIDGELDIARTRKSVNAVLPDDIAIYGLRPAPAPFHARYSALRRQYRYDIMTRKCPLHAGRAWRVRFDIDWDRAGRQWAGLRGRDDFTAFCCADTTSDNMICTIGGLDLRRRGALWMFTISADRFVYRMVRSLVGTVIDIARGKKAGSMRDIIRSRDRSRAGETAPACGLFLEHVEYGEADL